jgi:hypothetical protein
MDFIRLQDQTGRTLIINVSRIELVISTTECTTLWLAGCADMLRFEGESAEKLLKLLEPHVREE